jgi:hypothetical protein
MSERTLVLSASTASAKGDHWALALHRDQNVHSPVDLMKHPGYERSRDRCKRFIGSHVTKSGSVQESE